jgi:hypothetical protein
MMVLESRDPGEDLDGPPLSDIRRGPGSQVTSRTPVSHVSDIAAGLLRLTPDDRRIFIPSLIVMLERVAADEERRGDGREPIAHPATSGADRIGRMAP